MAHMQKVIGTVRSRTDIINICSGMNRAQFAQKRPQTVHSHVLGPLHLRTNLSVVYRVLNLRGLCTPEKLLLSMSVSSNPGGLIIQVKYRLRGPLLWLENVQTQATHLEDQHQRSK